jgi:hypothetical protein
LSRATFVWQQDSWGAPLCPCSVTRFTIWPFTKFASSYTRSPSYISDPSDGAKSSEP